MIVPDLEKQATSVTPAAEFSRPAGVAFFVRNRWYFHSSGALPHQKVSLANPGRALTFLGFPPEERTPWQRPLPH